MKIRHNYISTSLIFALFFLIMWWIIVIKQGNMPYVDQWTRAFVGVIADTPIYTGFRYVTVLGSKSFVQPLTVMMTMLILIVYKDFRPACIFGFGVLGTHLLNKLIKVLVARERPSISIALNAKGFSFPSGHSMVSMVCYGLLAFFISEKLESSLIKQVVHVSFACIILLIGISRYMINVHFLTDIITGYTIGFIILFYLMKLYQQLELKKKKKT